jgi:hypothetical protein
MKIYRSDEKLVRAVVKYLNLEPGAARVDARVRVYVRMEKLARKDPNLCRLWLKRRDQGLKFTLRLGQTLQVGVEDV